ncbi:MAG: amino acid adenylation domain-containing protein, partial [Planctomycetes bacterium]|nr:amino acid adenylation domain-containing protein [Planctomycetota bacterium]
MSGPSKRPFALTPAKQALLDRMRGERHATTPESRIPRRSADGPVTLSHGQERLWFLDQLEGGTSLYNIHLAFRIDGALDTPALEQSLREIVRRHEALRTSFRVVDGRPLQFVHPAGEVALPRVDLRAIAATHRESALLRSATDEAHRAFDLETGPLFRATLYALGERDHVLLLVMHHIVSDGWSSGVLTRELATLYDAFAAGRPSPLPELPIQYADFAEWQRRWLHGDVLERQLVYWKRKLAAPLPTLELPSDRSRGAAPTHRGANASIVFSRDLSDSLRDLCRREGVTPFMLLFAAFAAWLHRLTQQDDVVVGTPIANRGRAEIEDVVGFFVNTLVMRADLSGDPSFRELLGRIRETALEAYAHQDLPFETLVEAMQPERSLTRQPFFRTMFVFQNTPAAAAMELPGVTLRPLHLETASSRFDLTLFMEDADDGLATLVEYDTDLFDAATMERLLGHWRTLVEAIAADPGRRISELPILTADERHRALFEWAASGAAERDDRSVVSLFEERAAREGNAIALEFEGERISYDELNRRANRIAHRLRALGAGDESVVGVCARRSTDLCVGILGILKCGAAYAPLDPDYPRDRVAFMISESRMRIALTQSSTAPAIAEAGATVIRLDADRETFDRESEGNPARRELPDALAYVIFTSGSTGRPKGVAMTHRALRNLISWQLRQSSAKGTTLQFASSSFDVSFQEIFATLCGGGRLVLVSEEVRRDPTALLHTIEELGIERLFLPFVALQQLAVAAESDGLAPARLREIVTAGEPLRVTPQLVALARALPSCTITNQYGPTESHVVSAFTLSGPAGEWPLLPPIGRPIDGARLFVLDHRLEPVPLGVRGDLYIGGVALARGYVHRGDLTADRFIPDPFSREPGARLYRTGDVARYRSDGRIEFLGRSDDQVKVRGVRVEPGEIEAVIARHPGVRQVAVVTQGDETGDRRLAAFVVAGREAAPSSTELRSFAQSMLPATMIPSAFAVLDALPLTPSGKIDRRALASRRVERDEIDRVPTLPRTPTEALLAEIFAEFLRVRRIGTQDDFFKWGGHSLLATQVVSRIRRAFQVELPLRALFESPTVSGLAAKIDALSGQALPAPPIERAPRESELPLSFAQQRLWFL